MNVDWFSKLFHCCILQEICNKTPCHVAHHALDVSLPVLSKVDDFATFNKVEAHAKNSTF